MNKIISSPNLTEFPHGFTTIHSPDGSNSFFNMKGSNDLQVLKNRKMVEDLYPGYKLSFIQQTHSTDLVRIISPYKGEEAPRADASWTSEKNILVATMVADCAPVLMAFKKSKIVVAVHAGWRGALNGIVSNCLKQLTPYLNEPLNACIVAIGPHISWKNLEFKGAELELWRTHFPEAVIERDGKHYIDVSRKIKNDLKNFGISNIWQSSDCTFANSDEFFSHRRQKEKAGRQIGFIGLPV